MYCGDSDSCSSSLSEDCNLTSSCAKTGASSAAHPTHVSVDEEPRRSPPPATITRSIIHLDVDCFYCQCEELADPTGTLATRPLAIGQKHIVVTCNYVARSRGVKKLMLRTEAWRVCPDLVIREGSDLEPYRRQARRIYTSFRRAVASLPGGQALAKKGGMDEMYADVSCAVDAFGGQPKTSSSSTPDSTFVYGDDSSSSTISVSEDQSGATALINSPGDDNDDDLWGDRTEREGCAARLRVAAVFAAMIRRAVRNETGFTACAGVATSPMLAKLASELRKPNSQSILYPWRAAGMIDSMPLRKIPGLGSRTLKALESCLEEHNANSTRDQDWWACRDLLKIPRSSVISSLATRKAFESSCEYQCDLLLQRCRGVDPVEIVDDNGGIAKTVSVEDSYRRGTLTTRDGVFKALDELYIRLPRLLGDRRSDSDRPELSYPTTIRFSARIISVGCSNKRPFVTRAKQCSFDGKSLIRTESAEQRSAILQDAFRPLVENILFQQQQPLDVTKLNIATSNFADLSSDLQGAVSGSGSSQRSMTQFFSAKPLLSTTSSGQKAVMKKGAGCGKRQVSAMRDGYFVSKHLISNKKSVSPRSILPGMFLRDTNACFDEGKHWLPAQPSKVDIDPNVLSELPEDIAAEIAGAYGIRVPKKNSVKSKKVKIDSFFSNPTK